MPRYQNLLGGKEYANTPLYTTLLGLKRCLSVHCQLDDVPIISHDDYKAVSRAGNPQSENQDQINFPYGYLVLQSLALDPEFTPKKHISRQSNVIAVSDDGFQSATISKGFLFPSILMFEFSYFTNDFRKMFFLAEKLLILSGIDSLSFNLSVPNTNAWFAKVQIDGDSISFEPKNLEDPTNPGVYTLRTPIKVNTKIGLVKDVPKINNEGIITGSMNTEPKGI